ncbi:hypothetical protein [Asticcacaulis excentricus]|uniref:Uncharacterized protein n=1 Tax=Asticcacaulis excentricus (strain ATCC 15261 / DSM 4724 / KCTC 12464 / NCIMB 9791 / VKM B-1370 / CB 48) TaxID=573065 RepID=E8RPN1_ASTEC|nr:hypothetical protein [Asticcacaulis excentricus]ADU12008.1 hypothetical protein Astex_0310 [Asticcacaulis excentricus CB 48]
MIPDPTFGVDFAPVSGVPHSWEYLWGHEPSANLKTVLRRIGREPHQVGFREEAGNVSVYARAAGNAQPVPFALIFLGLTIEEANQIKQDLRLQGWSIEQAEPH